ncbi:uncharacterized protein LOC116604767 [Nematostella vectensis]|uniref:uncharacterized protein LOC116604767 n=1 Tax=Nematostella vectensis TaxID=45351 RepID=UPI00138FC13E|nr:uncharacterized protein LOC116604767 [Nematostella vectensis]
MKTLLGKVFIICGLIVVLTFVYFFQNYKSLTINNVSTSILDSANIASLSYLIMLDRACVSSNAAEQLYRPLCSRLSVSQPRVVFQTSCQYLDVEIVCNVHEEICQSWEWDVANYTLIYTNRPVNSTVCSKPKSNHKRVMRIIQTDGHVEYPGCTMGRRQCNWAHFDNHLNMRINTDPCCRRNGLEMAHHLATLLDKYDIHYVLISGAVVGWYRERDFVPYDNDVDFIIDEKDKFKFKKLVRRMFPHFGYTLVKRSGLYWVCPHDNCYQVVHPDVWYFHTFFDSEDRKMVSINYYVTSDDVWKQPYENLFPRQRGQLGKYQFWFPAKPVEYLDHEYGKDGWRLSMKCSKTRNEKYCVE